MSRRLLAIVAGGVIALGVMGATEAHPDHGSCAGGAPGAAEAGIAPLRPGPGFGTDFVSPIARSGDAQAFLAGLHALYCEPR